MNTLATQRIRNDSLRSSFLMSLIQGVGRRTVNFRGKYHLVFKGMGDLIGDWPRDAEVVTRLGLRLLHCDLNQHIYREIFVYGVHEFDVDWMCERLQQPGDVFVDAGACFGYHSLCAARRVGSSGHVYSLEPQPDVIQLLLTNAAHNQLLNIDADCIALGDSGNPITLHRLAGVDVGYASVATYGHESDEAFQCPSRTLDDYLEAKAVRPVHLVKLDVEGSEMAVLKGASQLLGSPLPPMWILEINEQTSHACGYQPQDLLEILSSFGYSFYQPVWGKMVRKILRLERCNQVRHGQNILCAIESVHRERLALVGVKL